VKNFRKTTQHLIPTSKLKPEGYDLYPTFPIQSASIFVGFEALAQTVAHHSMVIIDGYAGVMWEDFIQNLRTELDKLNLRSHCTNINTALKDESEIDELTKPFMGNDDPIFGTRFTGKLEDFFNSEKLESLHPNLKANINIVYGTGASLADWDGFLIYLDLPKNEIQFRARAHIQTNVGLSHSLPAKVAYKRSYFVDWPALNEHKRRLLPKVGLFVDIQNPQHPTFTSGDTLKAVLGQMSKNYFRVRPWFEPGAWGGQWIKRHIPELAQDAPNYAWSFELITPENGLLLESDGIMLELSFDMLMCQHYEDVLGQAAPAFKYEFPIRFDWLDTIDGGNLSLQCHPSPDYIQEHFGETFTQDETYYILEANPNASVYLGFQEGINKDQFKATLEHSFQTNTPVDIETYIQKHPAKKHELFLIPHGTVHCSGEGSVVLEISATPYIFTFKMYDWLRLDLDGNPRPINIERAFDNLDFTRQGKAVEQLIAKSFTRDVGEDWQILHLPTHPKHFYEIERLEFSTRITQHTQNQCHVLCLVEGTCITLETQHGMRQRFSYSETFVIPAAAESYILINEGQATAKVIKAYVKSGVTL
jgi:mannose-6-phosphate isomerase class I